MGVAYNKKQMGKALYRIHRPKTLSEVVGQTHITETLARAIKNGQLSHAYLFTGPRGTGKTSIARILAHEINQLPYDETATHIDIIEIDAASNRRIDEVRDLRDKVHTAPAFAKYKVYIIDEVHMLTREAFNALLKTLEEPPAHVVFVLATTEMHKLPETIVSRTQHFAFKPIEQSKVVSHLRHIAKHEKIAIDDDALELIAAHGEGSFRDSISLLDQIRSSNADTITLADVQMVLGVTSGEALENLLNAVTAGDAKQVIMQLLALRDQGASAAVLAKQLSQMVRARLLDNNPVLPPADSLALLRALLMVPSQTDAYATLEICLLEAAFGVQTATLPPKPTQDVRHKTEPPTVQPKSSETPAKPSPKKADTHKHTPQDTTDDRATDTATTASSESAPAEPLPSPAAAATLDASLWPAVLDDVKKTYNTLYGILRMAEPQFEGTTLRLTCKFAFHQKRLNDPKNKAIVIDTIKRLSGEMVHIVCEVGEAAPTSTPQPAKPAPAQPSAEPSPNPAIGAISNIFGGAELLES